MNSVENRINENTRSLAEQKKIGYRTFKSLEEKQSQLNQIS